jgi:hypothetical protein
MQSHPNDSAGVGLGATIACALTMRLPLAAALLMLAACTSTTDLPAAPSQNQVLCPVSVDDYCAHAHCDRTLDEARNDPALCGGLVTDCGPLALVDKQGTFYYLNGKLEALLDSQLVASSHCLAGPPTFDATRCLPTSTPLPPCPTP